MGNNAYISASGATARLRDLDVVSNNLANVGTPGFKRTESVFRSVLESALRDAEGRAQPGAPSSAFVSTAAVATDLSEGAAQHTGSPLHAMINGPGFFQIETPQGVRYTRAGNFVVNTDGNLALPSGEPVLGDGGTIAIPDGFAEIQPSGAIEDANGNIVGRLVAYRFTDLRALEREGGNLFRAREGVDPEPSEEQSFLPSSVEGANVQPSRELATLVMIQRAFETNLRAMQVDDETTQQLIEGIR